MFYICVVIISWRAGNGGGFTFRQTQAALPDPLSKLVKRSL